MSEAPHSRCGNSPAAVAVSGIHGKRNVELCALCTKIQPSPDEFGSIAPAWRADEIVGVNRRTIGAGYHPLCTGRYVWVRAYRSY